MKPSLVLLKISACAYDILDGMDMSKESVLKAHNLIVFNPLDRESWRRKIKDSLVLPTPDAGTLQHPKHQVPS